MTRPESRDLGLAFGALLASSATLVCCVLPAVFVTLGAGAALVGLLAAVPQLIWLSEHKALVFGVAGLLLAASVLAVWHGRSRPCPVDPRAARLCTRLRGISQTLCVVALCSYAVAFVFAFVLAR